MILWQSGHAPATPYWASIFNYFLSDDLEGYAEYDEMTLQAVKNQEGFLGHESFKHEGRGTFISYWRSEADMAAWARHPLHREAKALGVSRWYRYYHSLLARVESQRYHDKNDYFLQEPQQK
jgi:heme-degrading monooxygenase HmoA